MDNRHDCIWISAFDLAEVILKSLHMEARHRAFLLTYKEIRFRSAIRNTCVHPGANVNLFSFQHHFGRAYQIKSRWRDGVAMYNTG